MGRQLRFDPEHGIHHVYSRGTRRWTLFIDQMDYERFLRRLAAVCTRYDIRVYAYCLMGNHFHLVTYCPGAQLSAAMRDLKSVYARAHNDRHGFSGPLFESRFGSKLVTSYDYLQWLIRYIHRNPLAIDRKAPLHSHLWSSHAYFLGYGGSCPEWLDISFPLSFFSDVSSYRQFVEANQGGDEFDYAASGRNQRRSRVAAAAAPPSLSAITLTVALAAGCDVSQTRPRMRNGLAGLIALLASTVGGYTCAEIRDACGFGGGNSVYNAQTRARRRLQSDAILRDIHEAAVGRLVADPHSRPLNV